MIETYVLVLIFTDYYKGGIVVVPGYTSKIICEESAKDYTSRTRDKAFCIKGPYK